MPLYQVYDAVVVLFLEKMASALSLIRKDLFFPKTGRNFW